MSDYTRVYNFTVKDSLPTGDAGKVIKGTEIDVELNAASAAISSKADSNSPTFTGTPLAPTAASGTNNTQLATTAFVTNAVTATSSSTETLTNKTISLGSNTVSGTLAQFNTACTDANFAAAGANSDITSLSGLTTALSIAQGGTGATSASSAFSNLKQAATDTATGVVELATSAEAKAGTDTIRAITPSTLFGGLNASGTAPIYAARAWVNFNGTGTVAIRASGNVSSITDRSVGQYTVNFTTALPDADYSAVGAANFPNDNQGGTFNMDGTLSTSSCLISVSTYNSGNRDSDTVTFSVFR